MGFGDLVNTFGGNFEGEALDTANNIPIGGAQQAKRKMEDPLDATRLQVQDWMGLQSFLS